MTHPYEDAPETLEEEEETGRPGIVTALILLVLIISMITTLIWPILRSYMYPSRIEATPTPTFFREI